MRLGFAGLVFVLCGCAGLQRQLSSDEEKFKDHIGFMLYDPSAKKTLLEYNSSKYFTPASNTKIFTLYTALQILGDSIPALRYEVVRDSLIFQGTGDPSFLYRKTFTTNRIYEFLRDAPQKLFFSQANFRTEAFGPGWAWDDYPYPYSAERSPFPVYGNLLKVSATDTLRSTIPLYFSNHLVTGDSVTGPSEVSRDAGSNQIIFRPGKKLSSVHSWEMPFHVSSDLLVDLLSDTLKREVEEIDYSISDSGARLYSIPSDSLYRVMMQESDNFVAEQLLLLCADAVSDTLRPEIAIRYAQKNLLFDLPDGAVWVDGSGLSRYNLFTPRSIVRLWEKIYDKVPQVRLFALLPAGGKSGTLKNWNTGESKPWIYGKTGSLSNNQTLSGFLIARSGKILIFSFMNANFVSPSRDIRTAMQNFLVQIRNKY